MNHEACGVDTGALVRTAHHLTILVYAHQVAGFHAIEDHAVAVDQEVVFRAWNAQGDVSVDQVGHAKVRDQSIQCGQLAAGFPLGGGNVVGCVHVSSFL
ncbi:hypothetical protein D3C84_164180 [compost metagenome]